MAKGRIGRPENPQKTDTVEVTLPVSAVGYLNFLAKNTMLGATANEVAALILKNELARMLQVEKDRPVIPTA